MATTPTRPGASPVLLVGVAIAASLALWLRAYGVTTQILLDDEWHAIHKLSSSYSNIFRSFGYADHSIPLTLLYKAMAETMGLAEGRLRVLQIACGVALVPFSAWLAWRATRDAPATALFAFLVSAAPFLVMWSRFARPYAITLLLTVACVAAVWGWRTRRTRGLLVCAAITAGLSAWLHPISGMYAALACLFVFFEDVAADREVRPRPSSQSLKLGIAVAGSMGLLLAAPLIQDLHSLKAKAGGDQPGLETFERLVAVAWGGVPTPVVAIACALGVWGAVVMVRRDRRLGAYLVLLAVAPAAILTVLGAQWAHQGQNFLRYVLPLQLFLLFFGAVGAVSLARSLVSRRPEAAAWSTAAVLSAAYLYATPAIAQVATLGIWYGHLDYHWDYRFRWNLHKHAERWFDPPAFYLKLARMAPGSAPIIEAPFTHEAPFNMFAYYATFHRQPETMGMLHDLCLEGKRLGEPAHDRRFRFRKFVFLDDFSGVRQTGARYLLLHRERLHGRAFPEAERCLARLTAMYGAPVEIDARLAVFDLKPGEPAPALQ